MYKVVVLRGGPSVEHEVSMRTGASVLSALENTEYEPIDVIVSRRGEWLKNGKVWDPLTLLSGVDVVFNGLHGTYGEDGTLQRFLETHSIPFTGSGAFASATAMNKALAKDHVRHANVKLAPHMYANRDNIASCKDYSEAVIQVFDGPYVLKPVNSGSSVGTVIVRNVFEMETALSKLFDAFDKVLVEKLIRGREATVGVIDNFRHHVRYALPAVEIIPQSEFFDYDAKYNGKTQELCPGNFSDEQRTALAEAAKTIHEALNLRHYSRSDFIIADDGIYFLEVNTLPGLTEGSLLPKALDAVAITMPNFLRHVINESMRHTPDIIES